MTEVHLRLGRSGHDACATYGTYLDLIAAAPQLAPGEYWIDAMYQVKGYSDILPLDWGTLEVFGYSDWRLRVFAASWAGASELIIRPAGGMH